MKVDKVMAELREFRNKDKETRPLVNMKQILDRIYNNLIFLL